MKTLKNLICIIAVTITLAGCDNDYELRKTIFKEDRNFPGLPIYSEWGYNTFGAYFDGTPFISKAGQTPFKVVVDGINNTTSYELIGRKSISPYAIGEDMRIRIQVDGSPAGYDELVELHSTTVDLTSPTVKVFVSLEGIEYEANILSGELNFKRAQTLLVDTELYEVILSGYFQFQAQVNANPISITDGRFDLGVREDNFFLLF